MLFQVSGTISLVSKLSHGLITVREVLDSLYFNFEQEAEEDPAEAGCGEGGFSGKLTFVTVAETLIRMIKTLSSCNKKVSAHLLYKEMRNFKINISLGKGYPRADISRNTKIKRR